MIAAAVIGVAAGIVAGMLGVGGGILFVPALVIFLDQSQVSAEATSLLAIIPVAAVGAWRQYRYGNVRLREGLVVGALSIVGAIAGTATSNAVSGETLKSAFAALLLFTAVQMVRRGLRQRRAEPQAE